MPAIHVIRLRGPWECEPLARFEIGPDGAFHLFTEALPSAGRIQAPSDWGSILGNDFRGLARFTRQFNLPTNLDPSEQVWLVVEGVDYFGVVQLNQTALGRIVGYRQPVEFEMTRFLMQRNTLTIDVELPAQSAGVPPLDRPGREGLPGGLIGEVHLEIRS